ncbi:hypothetical protein BDR06DRAFT_1003710 [Suillus hirtellus]|nr:hypothetical protein BDR06DRAFT_1003710 [Suillus hirtellus]
MWGLVRTNEADTPKRIDTCPPELSLLCQPWPVTSSECQRSFIASDRHLRVTDDYISLSLSLVACCFLRSRYPSVSLPRRLAISSSSFVIFLSLFFSSYFSRRSRSPNVAKVGKANVSYIPAPRLKIMEKLNVGRVD